MFYSINWSARTRSVAGIGNPSAFAVFMLMTSSNFVGCSTGRSAGFAPFKILSVNGGAPKYVTQIRAIGHEAARLHDPAELTHNLQAVLEPKLRDHSALCDRSRTLDEEDRLGIVFLRCGKAAGESAYAIHVEVNVLEPQAQHSGSRRHRGYHDTTVTRSVHIPEHRQADQRGHGFLEKLQSLFARYFGLTDRQSCQIATGMR